MCHVLAEDVLFVNWPNTVIGLLGLFGAALALILSCRSNRTAKQANNISQTANSLAGRALKMHEDEGRVHLVVKPRMVKFIGEGEDSRPRAIVEVINLSTFPVTITHIHWKTNTPENGWLYWKSPTIAEPYGQLPVRLPAREALTASGTPTAFESLDDQLSVTAAVAFTACGERIEGMTQEWLDYCDTRRKENHAKGARAST